MINSRLCSADNTIDFRITEKQQLDQLFPEQPKKVKTENCVEQLGSFQDFLNSQALIQYEVEDLFHNPLNQVIKIKTIEDRRLERQMAKEMSPNGDITRTLEPIPSTDPPHFAPGETNLKQKASPNVVERPRKVEKENVPTNLNLICNDIIIKPSKNIVSEKSKYCESLKPENVDEKPPPSEIFKNEIVLKVKPTAKSSPNLLQKSQKEEISNNTQAQQSSKKPSTHLKETVEPDQLKDEEVKLGSIQPQASIKPNYELKSTHLKESTKFSTSINKNVFDNRAENTLPKIMSPSASTLQIVRNEAKQITTHFKCKK